MEELGPELIASSVAPFLSGCALARLSATCTQYWESLGGSGAWMELYGRDLAFEGVVDPLTGAEARQRFARHWRMRELATAGAHPRAKVDSPGETFEVIWGMSVSLPYVVLGGEAGAVHVVEVGSSTARTVATYPGIHGGNIMTVAARRLPDAAEGPQSGAGGAASRKPGHAAAPAPPHSPAASGAVGGAQAGGRARGRASDVLEVVTGCVDGSVRILCLAPHVPSMEAVATLGPHPAAVTAVAAHPSFVLCGQRSGEVQWWRRSDGAEAHCLRAAEGEVTDVSVHGDDCYVFSAEGASVVLASVQSGVALRRLDLSAWGVSGIRLGVDALRRRVAVGLRSGNVLLASMTSEQGAGEGEPRQLVVHTGDVFATAFAPGMLITTGKDGLLAVTCVLTGRVLTREAIDWTTQAWSDGRTAIVVTLAAEIHVVDIVRDGG